MEGGPCLGTAVKTKMLLESEEEKVLSKLYNVESCSLFGSSLCLGGSGG